MRLLFRIEDAIFGPIGRLLDGPVMPFLARLLFLAVLAPFFWASGLTKLGDGITGFFNLSVGAYAQVLPKAMEAVGYDASQLSALQKAIVLAGTWGEFILPALVILGLFTRAASLGMIAFIIVMSVVDVTGHGADAATIGMWFDRIPDAKILDQRALWIFMMLYLVYRGAGALSLDAVLRRRAAPRYEDAIAGS